MSVLVKGMKMPKSCAACRFRTSDSESIDPFTDYCYITNARLGRYDNDRAKWKKERRKGCPLVAVSEDAVSPCEVCPLVKVDETAILDGWDKVYPDDDDECVVGCDGICEECPMGKEKDK